ncbi:MFS transporter, AAHS family, 4-hydroxybenzoate transporter [Variovorax sp. HW608]|uniref:MFS transporter n=1 Tax=Variovorax sp. HW608 TaxID=1034889 RepID=UPI00081FD7CA|nr:MFS transporter [Variovorax sp. HW608]SCK15790.1 MFS transporter, AAHS family, 4-hydroxybenzoate transporter [Variovorax sp. HW608]
MTDRVSRANVQTLLNETPFTPYQWMVFGLCFLIVLLDGFDTAAIGFIAPSLISEWGIDKSALGPVLSAALFGLAFGALSAGPLADRFGRKSVLTVAVVIMGAASLVSASSGSLTSLTFWRFITGLGLGAAMPNAVTLMNEYCPDSKRSFITNCMFCGFPVGSAFGGFFAAWLIPHFGWRSLLILGGIVPLLLAVLMLVALPESVRFMVARHYPADRIRKILSRITPRAAAADSFTLHELHEPAHAAGQEGPQGLRLIFTPKFIVGTLMLWIAYFMGLVIVYGLVNWMPVLFKEAGVPPAQASVVAALFQLGGVGAIFFGLLMDRWNANLIIATGYFVTCLAVAMIGQVLGAGVPTLVVAVFLAGLVMNAAQSSMQALAAEFYPTSGRASGVSWMLGIGRFGGIAGSFLVAELSRRHLELPQVFLIVGIPGLIAAAALVIKNRVTGPAGGAAMQRVVAH